MKPKLDFPSNRGELKLRVESLPFSDIPGQSKLFLEYQSDPVSLQRFYPTAVESHTQLASRIPNVLSNYQTDRKQLCDALESMNRSFSASRSTFDSIDLLRREDTVAVLTGQQAGLFGGPLYTIYKALSAVKMASCLRNRGINAVPVFWAATEDHDFEEVSNAFAIGEDGDLIETKYDPEKNIEAVPVGSISIENSIVNSVRRLFDSLPATEFTAGILSETKKAWRPGNRFGTAFCEFIASVLGEYGLVVADPLDGELKRLAAPIYSAAVERSEQIVSALTARSQLLDEEGYHAQVLVTDDYFPLFWHDDEGRRKSLKKREEGIYRVSGEKTEFSVEELVSMAADEPEKLSPGVMLRPVVQDYLFPTICYFGGGAEIAYFAQNSEVYRILDRPFTPILHRQSFTVVEPRHRRTMEKFGLGLTNFFDGAEKIVSEIVEKYIDPGTSKLFPETEEKINIELNRLDQAVSQLDVTLAENLAKRRRKILYHIGALRKKFVLARLQKDEVVNRQIRTAFTSLVPRGSLQERTLSLAAFTNKYGKDFIHWIYDSVDLDDCGHRIIYL